MEKLKEKAESIAPGNAAFSGNLAEQGQRIYLTQLKNTLEPRHTGEYVAINPETGAHFLGATGTEALSRAHAAMPTARFYLKKIGSETAHKMGGHASRVR